MSHYVFKMPDLGEGTVDAEIVAWHTKPGDAIVEDQLIVEVMTDKAAVEVPAPVSGRVVSITGAPGDKVAVGSPLIVFDTSAGATADGPPPKSSAPVSAGPVAAPPAVTPPPRAAAPAANAGHSGRVMTSGAGAAAAPNAGSSGGPETSEIKVIGLRRLIAERMSEAKRNIPHFAYVEEVDVTELESLRNHLNASRPSGTGSLSYLPLVVMALTRVLESFPQCNVLYDAARGVLVRHRAVHVGIATQTPDGLKVPVVRNAESLGLWEVAAEIRRLAERARTSKSTRDELVGSTITVTSLGKLGGIASTPIINAPEVAIIGLNKAVERPVVLNGTVVVRRIMNLSSSFDHRFVDGYDAAAMIQALKELLEHPATIFIPKVKSK
jgi:2-oxoisovalerate dehydrogenase E2 component (dihydrolipoyl transacylase)